MRFKVGDKVRIRKDLNLYNDYDNCGTVSEMLEYKGDIATIMKVFELSNCYKINIDNQQWLWTDEMFEPVEENTIEYKGKKYDVVEEKYYESINEYTPTTAIKPVIRLMLKEHKDEPNKIEKLSWQQVGYKKDLENGLETTRDIKE